MNGRENWNSSAPESSRWSDGGVATRAVDPLREPGRVVDPLREQARARERLAEARVKRRQRQVLVLGGLGLVLAGAAGATWWFRDEIGLEPLLSPTSQTVEIDPELQDLVESWRQEDEQTLSATEPSDWHLKELQKLKDRRDSYTRQLESLRLDYAAAETRARETTNANLRQSAAWEASLVADQAKQVRAELARYERRITAMEQQLGLAP